MLPHRPRPSSRVGSARSARRSAAERPPARTRPSSAPTPNTGTRLAPTSACRLLEAPDLQLLSLRVDGKSIRRSACSPRVFSSKLLSPSGGARQASAPRPLSAGRRKMQIVSRPLRAYAVPIDMQKTYIMARNGSFLRAHQRLQFSRVKICSEASEESDEEVSMKPFGINSNTQESLQRTYVERCRTEQVSDHFNESSPYSALTSKKNMRSRATGRDARPNHLVDESSPYSALTSKKNLRSRATGRDARPNHHLVELETVSNDGSDASQASLGARIQRIATLQRQHIQEQICEEAFNEDQIGDREAEAEDVWSSSVPVASNHEDQYQEPMQDHLALVSDSTPVNFQFKNRDWQQLLEQNNELLSKLSGMDSPFPAAREKMTDNEHLGTESSIVAGKTLAKVKKPSSTVGSQVNQHGLADSDEDDLNENKTATIKSSQPEQYFSQSNKTLRPITPVTPDCILEDINEESSEDELDSLLSDYKSAAEDPTMDHKNKLYIEQNTEFKISSDNDISFYKISAESDKICSRSKAQGMFSSAFPIIIGDLQQSLKNQTTPSSDIGLVQSRATVFTEVSGASPSGTAAGKFTNGVHLNFVPRQPTPEAVLDKVMSVPPRSEFLLQKNALAELLRSTHKKKEQQKQENNKINVGGCLNRCSCSSTSQSFEDNSRQPLVDKIEDGVDDRVQTPNPSYEGGGKPTVLVRLTSEDSKPQTLSEMIENLLKLTQGLTKTWLLESTNEEQKDDEASKEQLLQVHDRLVKLCLQVGLHPQSISWPELHTPCKQEASRLKADVETRLQKSLDLTRKLLDDKKELAERCEDHTKKLREAVTTHQCKVQQLQARHQQELQDSRQRLLAAEQAKREKWTVQKTKAIKETSFRGLETRIKDLVARHRDEISQLKADHWQAVRAAEERCVQQLRQQEQQLRARYDEEREEAVKRERDREQQRLELQLQQSTQAAREQAQAAAHAHQEALRDRTEQHERALVLAKREHEAALERALTSAEQIRKDLLAKMAERAAEHKTEFARLSVAREEGERRLRDELGRQAEAKATEQARTITERLKRQRDRDIERAVRGVQQQAQEDQRRLLQQSEHRYKRLLTNSEEEVSGAQRSEAALRTRLLEARAEAAQREEESLCLRARLHQQHQELHHMQQMVQTARDADGME